MWLFICVFSAFAVATAISFVMNTRMSRENTNHILSTHLDDVCSAVNETDSLTILQATLRWADYFDEFESFDPVPDFLRMLGNIAMGNDIDEINFINEEGIIISSNNHNYFNYVMDSQQQSREFLVLLRDTSCHTFVQDLRTQGYDKVSKFRYAGSTFKKHKGFLQLGISEAHYKKTIESLLKGSTRYRRIGDKGSIYIYDSNLSTISAPVGCTDTTATQMGITHEVISQNKPNTIFLAELNGVDCYCMYSIEQGCIVLATQPVSEATLTRNTAVILSSITVFSIFLILFLAIWMLIRRLVVKNIDKVNSSLTEITNGDLDVKVDVRDSNEFDSLSNDINKTVDKLKVYIHEAETRMDADLALAQAIQHSALPTEFPAFTQNTEFDIYADMKAAKTVGGDFYDFYFSGEDTFTITIADVSGKGIPAAMFMMRGKSTLKNVITSTGMSLGDACSKVNNMLCQGNDTNMFFTGWIGSINLSTGLMKFINAGHNLPLLRRKGGRFEYLASKPFMPMAVFDITEYATETIQLYPGDELFLYTDGVTEATSSANQLFGEQLLLETLNNLTDEQTATPECICKAILHEVQAFAEGAEQSDDITMLCFRYEGK